MPTIVHVRTENATHVIEILGVFSSRVAALEVAVAHIRKYNHDNSPVRAHTFSKGIGRYVDGIVSITYMEQEECQRH